jgi:membrane protein implicated in regulation of membrane protease activity
MEIWLMWIIAGFVLGIAELLTGTFYLLVLGLGAFAGAVVAYAGGNEIVQALVASVVALAGAFFVHSWHVRNRASTPLGSNFLDKGQPVVLEGWVDEGARVARVKYRGAWWDARMASPADHPSPGTTLYIESQDGNTLVVALAPPR